MVGSVRLRALVCVRQRERDRQNEKDGEEVFVSYQALRVEERQDKLRNDKWSICYLN